MDEKTTELIAIGASVAAHCQPCLTFHVNRAAGLCIDEDEINQAVQVGEAVGQGAAAAIKRHGREAIANRQRPACCTGDAEAGQTSANDQAAEGGCCGGSESRDGNLTSCC